MSDTKRESLTVAVSGETVQRQDQCPNCHTPMLYWCHADGEPYGMFCDSSECPLYLVGVDL